MASGFTFYTGVVIRDLSFSTLKDPSEYPQSKEGFSQSLVKTPITWMDPTVHPSAFTFVPMLDIYSDTITASIDNKSFGSIVGEIYRTITILNLYGETVTISSIDFPAGISSSSVFPIDILATSDVQIPIRAIESEGDLSFTDASITINHSKGSSVISGLSGSRVQLIKWRPVDDIKETLAFKTDILTKRNGTEQRISMAKFARQNLSMKFAPRRGADLEEFNNSMLNNLGKNTLVPMWHESMMCRGPLLEGDSSITVDSTAFSDIGDGGLFTISDGDFAEGIYTIESFSGDTIINIDGTVKKDFLKKCEIIPLKNVYIKSFSGSAMKDGFEPKSVEMENTEFYDIEIPDNDGFSSISLTPFLNEYNFVVGGISNDSVQSITRVDSGIGVFRNKRDWDLSIKKTTKGFFTKNKEDCWKVKGFLMATKGKWKSFYLPSFNDGIKIQHNISIGTLSISIKNVKLSKIVNGQNPFSKIRLIKMDGKTIIRSIVSCIETSSELETLTIDSPINEEIDLSFIYSVELVELCRFDSDTFSLIYKGLPGKMSVSVPVINVIQ